MTKFDPLVLRSIIDNRKAHSKAIADNHRQFQENVRKIFEQYRNELDALFPEDADKDEILKAAYDLEDAEYEAEYLKANPGQN